MLYYIVQCRHEITEMEDPTMKPLKYHIQVT